MSALGDKFNALAADSGARKKAPPPFSLRLTAEERARLEADAAGAPLGGYIRKRLFGEAASPRKRRGNSPVKDAVNHLSSACPGWDKCTGDGTS